MSKIWYKDYDLDEVNGIFGKYMTGYLDIKATEIQEGMLIASMPVHDKVKQPFGILHGGASVVLAESVGSIASNMVINQAHFSAVGMEINANHIKSISEGIVYAYCSPLHLGLKSHVWDIKIKDKNGKLICISRLTVAIIEKK
ncbi:hotdog fold thioesterase [Sphingobacterium sp. LRF_L2]|uniref:hotdog fold thioesterase n=1 Tax=Sphingobacterium sp. LRF_L2 TaxID=3369421 RepID=UPI003F60FB0C